MTRARIAVVVLVLGGIAIGALSSRTPLLAQGERREADAIAALVNEMRDLRIELAAASQRSVRAQLLLGRLQMQDQRLAYLDSRRSDALAKALDAARGTAGLSEQIQRMEECRDSATPTVRRECEGQLRALKETMTAEQTRELQLRNQENDLANAVAQEQARWSEISSRLDELERSLAR